MKAKRKERPEEQLQKACVQYLELKRVGEDGRCLWFHVPNGAGRSRAEAGILKAMGVKAGVHDLIFILEGPRVYTVEFKSEMGCASEEQQDFASRLMQLGGGFAVVRDVDRFIGLMKAWGVTK